MGVTRKRESTPRPLHRYVVTRSGEPYRARVDGLTCDSAPTTEPPDVLPPCEGPLAAYAVAFHGRFILCQRHADWLAG